MESGKRFTHDELRELVESGRAVEIPWRLIQPFQNQPRKYFNKARLDALRRSIAKKGQIKTGEVRVCWGGVSKQFELVDGERRWRACALENRPFRAVVVDIRDAEEQYDRSFISNLHREGHTPLEIAAAVERIRNSSAILALPKGNQIAAVADEAGRSESWVLQYLGLARLAPGLRRRLEPDTKKKDRLRLAVAFRLSTLPLEEQLTTFDRIRKKKLSGRQAQRHIDKTILGKGLDKSRRGRSPSDDLDVLVRFLTRTEMGAGDVLALDSKEMGRMIAQRDARKRRELVQSMNLAQQSLHRISQRLDKAMKDNPVSKTV